jgi:hypothetical protein
MPEYLDQAKNYFDQHIQQEGGGEMRRCVAPSRTQTWGPGARPTQQSPVCRAACAAQQGAGDERMAARRSNFDNQAQPQSPPTSARVQVPVCRP